MIGDAGKRFTTLLSVLFIVGVAATQVCGQGVPGGPPVIPGQIFRVPQQYGTIQNAINVADDGDTVLVSNGTYAGFVVTGKTITIRSVDGSLGTIIDGAGTQSAVRFEGGGSSRLEGFTIQNGNGTAGGGIYCNGASPIIEDNVVRANGTDWIVQRGGGIYCTGECSAIIRYNEVLENRAYRGGGIAVYDLVAGSQVEIQDNYIGKERLGGTRRPNSACKGGGIYIEHIPQTATVTIWNNKVYANVASDGIEGAGGGICLSGWSTVDGQVVVGNQNEICENIALRTGGGLYAVGCAQLTISGNAVLDNLTSGVLDGDCIEIHGGAGMYLSHCYVDVVGNYLEGNWDTDRGWGGGICCVDNPWVYISRNRIKANGVYQGGGGIFYVYHTGLSSPILACIVNNLIIANRKAAPSGGTTGRGGGGICVMGGSPIITNNTITENVVTHNNGSKGGGIYCGKTDYTAECHPIVTNTILWANGMELLPTFREIFVLAPAQIGVNFSDVWTDDGLPYTGDGNIYATPLFDFDYRIPANSLCVDNGDPLGPSRPGVDFELQERNNDGNGDTFPGVDIGWDEHYD